MVRISMFLGANIRFQRIKICAHSENKKGVLYGTPFKKIWMLTTLEHVAQGLMK